VEANVCSRPAPTKAIEAGLKGGPFRLQRAAPLHCPAGALLRHGSGMAQGRSPRLTLKQPLLTCEARSGRGRNVS